MRNRFNLEKVLAVMVGITLLQAVGVAAVTIILLTTPGLRISRTEIAVLFPLTLISVSGSLVTLYARPITRFGSQLRQTKSAVEELSKLNLTLRAQRHDFQNHLQVVYSLMELEAFEEAAKYIETVYRDIQKVNRVLKTGIPAVNAILHAKAQMCESRGIRAEIDIRSSFSDISVPDWELCRVLGNIIDNSINALMDSKREGEKVLTVELFETIRHYGFRIGNNGPAIPRDRWKRIFEPGFTTRPGGQGMGLAICRNILSGYGGSLKVKSGDELTVFEGIVPRHPVIQDDD
jgi:two-component system sensor histidine kinase AgrC